MQPPCGFSDDLPQAGFDIHVDVFELSLECEKTVLNFFRYFAQTVVDGLGVFCRNDALLSEHFGMSARAADVLAGHTLIDINRCVNGFHDRVRSAGETATPHRVRAIVGAAKGNEESLDRASKHGKQL